MREQNLATYGSRWILNRGTIAWFIAVLVSHLYITVNAQSDTEAETGQYGLSLNSNLTTGIIMAVVIFAFFFVGTFTVWLYYHSDDSSSSSASTYPNSSNQRPQNGLNSSVIDTFPILIYSAVKEMRIGRETLECAVCLSEFKEDENLCLIPKCCHVFHPDCINEWLSRNVTCPVCRANLSEPTSVPLQELATGSLASVTGLQTGEVAITVDESKNTEDAIINYACQAKNGPPRQGKLPRSYSTGHSLLQREESLNRYTLRLPEQVRREIIERARLLRRTRSVSVVLVSDGSSRKGESGSSRTHNSVLLRMPPFGFRGSTIKS